MIGEKMYNMIFLLDSIGKSQREIAKFLNLSKTTVNKYLNMPKEEIKRRILNPCRESDFDIACDFIKQELERPGKMRISKLYQKVKKKYPNIKSKQRAFYNFLNRKKKELNFNSKKRYFKPITDDMPGRQVQVDPGEFTVYKSNEEKFKVYFVVFIFSYSRNPFVYFQSSPFNTEDFIKAHLAAFQYFGCIAKEFVYDQTKLVVIKEQYREVDFNKKFYQFAMKHDFAIRVCEGYDPQSKGKVERFVQEVKKDFLEGEYFQSIDDIRDRSFDWLASKSNRIHSATLETPAKLFAEEKRVAQSYYSEALETRKVDKTGLISYKGNHYSVPFQYQRKTVLIKVEKENLIVMTLDSEKKIAQHKICHFKSKPITNNNHYRNYKKSLTEIIEEAKKSFKSYKKFDKLLEKILNDNKKIKRDQVRALSKLHKKYEHIDWNIIIEKALVLNKVSATKLEQLAKKEDNARKAKKINSHHPNNHKIKTSSLSRDTNYYDRLVTNVE